MELRLPELAGENLVAFVLVLARVGGLFVFAPFFSARLIPRQVRLVAAGALALALTPLATGGRPVPDGVAELVGLVAKEVMVGLSLAFAIGALGAAIQAAAGLLDAAIGFSLAAIVDPVTSVQNAILGQFYSLFLVMVLILTGGDHIMIAGFAASYEIVPLDAFPSMVTLSSLAVSGFVQVFVIGLEIVAPVLIALIVIDAAFGLVSRAVPQMNVLFVGLPVKIIAGFVVIGASLPFVAGRLQAELEQAVRAALQVLGAA